MQLLDIITPKYSTSMFPAPGPYNIHGRFLEHPLTFLSASADLPGEDAQLKEYTFQPKISTMTENRGSTCPGVKLYLKKGIIIL